jgi:hypothetical protein
MDSGCSRHIIENKKWFSSLTPLSHKEYVTFGDDKKGKVLSISIIKINDCFTLNDITLVDRLRYNLLSDSQLCDADLSVFFRKSDSHVLDSSSKRICDIFRIGNIFQSDADLSVFFRKSDSHVLDSSSKRICDIFRIGNIFQADFSSAQSSLMCLIL